VEAQEEEALDILEVAEVVVGGCIKAIKEEAAAATVWKEGPFITMDLMGVQ
jgi:hypothetical protein